MSRLCRIFPVISTLVESSWQGNARLLLRLGGISIIRRLLKTLDHPALMTPLVITDGGEAELAAEIAGLATVLPAPVDKSFDLRYSVSMALAAIEREFAPGDGDGWLLVTADHPVLDRNLIGALVDCWVQTGSAILVPRFKQRRGHPTLFRWRFASEVTRIPEGRGLNWLFREYADNVTELAWDNDSTITDLNTAEDCARLQAMWQNTDTV